MPLPRKILRIKTVADLTGYSRVQVWRKSRNPDDDFPAAVQLGANASGFFEDEIAAWLESRRRLGSTPKAPDPVAA